MRDLGFSTALAGSSWALFGIGAALGSLLSGMLGDKIGAKNAHIMILSFNSLSCFLALFHSFFWLNVSVFLMGFTTTGNVTLTNALALKIVGRERLSNASSSLTMYFGIFQAIFSLLFVYTLDYLGYSMLFMLCGVALILSALVLVPLKSR